MWTSLCCFTACCKENECFWSDVDLVFDFDSPQRWSNQTEIHAHQCNSVHPHDVFLDMLTQQCCYIDSVLTQILLPSQCCCSGCWSSAQSHVDWRPSHWRSHELDKLLTVEAFWITPMFDFAQSCLPFLFVTGLTRDLHCNSILCICQHKLANKEQQHSNVIATAKDVCLDLESEARSMYCRQGHLWGRTYQAIYPLLFNIVQWGVTPKMSCP